MCERKNAYDKLVERNDYLEAELARMKNKYHKLLEDVVYGKAGMKITTGMNGTITIKT